MQAVRQTHLRQREFRLPQARPKQVQGMIRERINQRRCMERLRKPGRLADQRAMACMHAIERAKGNDRSLRFNFHAPLPPQRT